MKKRRSPIPKGYKTSTKGQKTNPFWAVWLDHIRKRAVIHHFADKRTRSFFLRKYPGSIKFDDIESTIVQKQERQKERRARRKERHGLASSRVVEGVTPDELASTVGVTKRLARRWIEEGGAPRHAQDVGLSILTGKTLYKEPKAGKGKRISNLKLKEIGRAMRRFVEAVRGEMSKRVVQGRYRKWYTLKKRIRSHVSREVWAEFIEMMGSELDLPDIGVFSKEHFRKS